jgi:hypothetical protein
VQVVEGFEELEGQQFADGGREGLLELPLLLDEQVEGRGHVVHDHAQVTVLHKGGGTSRTSFRKYSRIATMLQCSTLAIMLSSRFL